MILHWPGSVICWSYLKDAFNKTSLSPDVINEFQLSFTFSKRSTDPAAGKGKTIAVHLVKKAFEVLQQSNLGFYWFERKDIVHSEVFIKLPSNKLSPEQRKSLGGLLAGLPEPMSLEEYDRLCTMDIATTSHGPPKSGWEFDDIEKTIKKVAETPKESLFNKHGKPKFPTTSEIPEMVKSLNGRKPTAMAVGRTLRNIKLKKWVLESRNSLF